MHTFAENSAGVPAFLAKLWRLVDDPDTNNLICWRKDGRSFIIQNQAQFARELLPLNYKHNNMASFIRQLNMYGFHKITSIENGGLKFDRDEMEFSHPCFKRNCAYLLEHIKRKIANTKSLDEKAAAKPEAVSKVLQDVKAMRGRQDSLDSRFSVMKQENEALWREIASLRQKHAKQQQIVNKLIQFLITIVQPSRNMTSVKRHIQLMIDDTPEHSKLRKTSETESDGGPVIHELREELLDEVTDPDNDLLDPHSPYVKSALTLEHESNSPLNVERPQSSGSMASQNYDYSNQSVDELLGITSSAIGTTGASIEQSASPNGMKLAYHVTEAPDGYEAVKNVNAFSPTYIEDNVLTTPMARSQLIKQRNKDRRQQDDDLNVTAPVTTTSGASTSASAAKVACRIGQHQSVSTTLPKPIIVKVEQPDIDDSLDFLSTYADNRLNANTLRSAMMSPNINKDSQSAVDCGEMLGADGQMPTQSDMALMGNTAASAMNMYNSNDFLADDMPTDIFDNTSLMDADQLNEPNIKVKRGNPQDFGRTAVNSGKFSAFVAGNNSTIARTDPSTSAAVCDASPSTSSSALIADGDGGGKRLRSSMTSQAKSSNNNNTSGNMTVAKYNQNNNINNNEELLRLSTPDEVHGHLENMQDELETLKDLLRGDNYSLDANTLMGIGSQMASPSRSQMYLAQGLDGDILKLFHDSEILGLQLFPTEGYNDKKGSELATYQPMYDLSDIIDMDNEKPALKDSVDEAQSNEGTAAAGQVLADSPMLNTPYHDMNDK